jgi:perosamine synthetase
LDNTLRILRDHGMSREQRYVHVRPGYNYRMTNMQAAIGIAQIERLSDIHTRRNAQAAHYARRFKDNPRLTWRPTADWCRPVHWLATITLRRSELRDSMLSHLKDKGFEGRPMVFPVHRAEHFRKNGGPKTSPVATSISARSLHLPSSTNLKPESVDAIADEILAWLNQNDP